MKTLRISIILFLAFAAAGCAGSYAKKIQASEEAFYSGAIDTAVKTITPLAQDSAARDRLLYYMEAGVVFHSQGDYQTSLEIFSRADEMADEIKTSLTGTAKSFLLSDREGEFQGENFERLLIKYYLALDQALTGDLQAAKRTLRKLEADLKDMKYEDAAYKQVLVARYLNALVSEELKEFNDARVQYRNLENFGVDAEWLQRERYLLAKHANDRQDLARYQKGRTEPLFKNSDAKTGELIVFAEMGKAAVKESRGDLLSDEQFALALRVALDAAILSQGSALTTVSVLAMLGTAENPIPKFVEREAPHLPQLFLQETALPPSLLLTNFDWIAEKNFNENYSSYVTRNVASIATKIVIAAIAAEAVSRQIKDNTSGTVGVLAGFAVGLGAGGAVAATVKPDLRSWRLLPAGFYAVRVILPEGTYPLFAGEGMVYGNKTGTVQIHAGKKTFVSLRIFKPAT